MIAPLHVSDSSGCKQESSARGSHKAALLAFIYTRYVNFSKASGNTSQQQWAYGYSGDAYTHVSGISMF